ncbi:pilus assembly protein TadG-related protein [Nocardioides gansuensis]|nr:pilus assembly protein TadG-related protein [Nocardioides gansuensis]
MTTRTATVQDEERGAASLILVLFTIALLTVAGVVIDTGYAMAAKRQAIHHAEQAARMGADALNRGALRDGVTQVDPTRAKNKAEAYLSLVGATGTVAVNGGEVTVTVTGKQNTKILSAVGIGAIPFAATATGLSINQDAN